MTNIIGQDKPPLADLAHHGVKGMKWGVRRTRPVATATSGGKKVKIKEKVTSSDIQDARRRHNARVSKIYEADRNLALAQTTKGKKEALKVIDKYAKEIANTQDARIASKFTRGEKIALIGGGTIILPGVGTVAMAALVGANAHKTRRR